MLPINVAVNAPRLVRLTNAAFSVSALRFRHWGAVAAWLLDRTAPPPELDLAALGIDIDTLSPEVADLLRFQRDLRINWPVRLASRAWFVVLEGTDGGRARLVWEAVRVHQPAVTEADAAAIVAAGPTDEEYGRFLRACLHGDPDYRPPRRVDGGRPDAVETDDWSGLFGFLGSARNWTPEVIAEMTFPQIRVAIDQAEREAGKAGGPRTTAAQARAALNLVKSGRFGGMGRNGTNGTGHP
jgi:hypothetical protein